MRSGHVRKQRNAENKKYSTKATMNGRLFRYASLTYTSRIEEEKRRLNKMADFLPITTQEQLDNLIKDRLGRERETLAKKYEEYTSPDDLSKIKGDYDKQIASLTKEAESSAKKYADFDRQITERDSKIKSYETASVKTRIAHETGLPYEMASRLSGESEDDIRKDAESLVKLIGKNKPIVPLADQEEKHDGGKNAAVRALAKSLKGE